MSIYVRALVHGWRHTEGRVCGVDIIEPVDLVAEASGRSPSTTPEGPAQPGHRQRVGGSESSRCSSALRILNRWPGDPSFESCTTSKWSWMCRLISCLGAGRHHSRIV